MPGFFWCKLWRLDNISTFQTSLDQCPAKAQTASYIIQNIRFFISAHSELYKQLLSIWRNMSVYFFTQTETHRYTSIFDLNLKCASFKFKLLQYLICEIPIYLNKCQCIACQIETVSRNHGGGNNLLVCTEG